MKNSVCLLIICQCLILSSFLKIAVALPLETSAEKRSAVPDSANEDYPDYQLGVRYDEYPMIVPKKRTALLVNRLMVALKDALEEDERERNNNMVDGYRKFYGSDNVRTMDLQRRGHQSLANNGQNKGRTYWRCYFNAVTCF